ncbi:flagellar basal-body MS-ring/collar protein FliF [Longirhabdus pacifica]|uniref:flagellar basal-body MS-ring/collar protein FliF n=1 Tax=Longirhabdus pacifica TaxID=2305227 RepID=UPI001008C705|nr:flagellar basal-body MS-ring/collar protein FliF [Longirhabdus pacifica]
MKETWSKYKERLTQYWSSFTKKQKILFSATFIALIFALGITIFVLSRTEYTWAYHELDGTDMAAVTEYLNSQNIPYELGASGTSIAIPSKDVNQVKVDIAGANLVQNGSQGFEIFRENISGFGMTDNEFKLLRQDSLSGEIEKLLKDSFGEIKSASVILSLPEDSPFVNDTKEFASASVSLDFSPGFRPSQKVTDTIYNLVQTSVGKDHMPLENITISGPNGELFPSSELDGGMLSDSSIVDEQFRIKQKFEQDVESNMEDFFKLQFGEDRVIVRVMSTLNFDQKSKQQTLYTPVIDEENRGIERSIQEIEKSVVGASTPDGGVPGTGETDIPGYQTTDNDQLMESDELERIVNYEVNESQETIISSPFVVEDVTISLAIRDEDNTIDEAMQEKIINSLESNVKTLLANSNNLDNINVEERVELFVHSFYDEQNTTNDVQTSNLLWYALAALAVAIVIGATIAIASRRNSNAMMEQDLPDILDGESPSMKLENLTKDHEIRHQLELLAKTKPDEFVKLMRTWLVEE